MTINCFPTRHVQSMLLATDSVGLDILMGPTGLDQCPADMSVAVGVETNLTPLIRSKGYTARVMMTQSWTSQAYVDDCRNIDVMVEGWYSGTNLHAYETMFVKTERHADVHTLEVLTEWHDLSNYSSYDVC